MELVPQLLYSGKKVEFFVSPEVKRIVTEFAVAAGGRSILIFTNFLGPPPGAIQKQN